MWNTGNVAYVTLPGKRTGTLAAAVAVAVALAGAAPGLAGVAHAVPAPLPANEVTQFDLLSSSSSGGVLFPNFAPFSAADASFTNPAGGMTTDSDTNGPPGPSNSYASWSTMTFPANETADGTPVVTLSLSHSASDALTCFVLLYAVSSTGSMTLLPNQVTQVNIPAAQAGHGTTTVSLPALDHTFAAGSTLELILSAVATGRQGNTEPDTITVTTAPAEPSELGLPLLPFSPVPAATVLYTGAPFPWGYYFATKTSPFPVPSGGPAPTTMPPAGATSAATPGVTSASRASASTATPHPRAHAARTGAATAGAAPALRAHPRHRAGATVGAIRDTADQGAFDSRGAVSAVAALSWCAVTSAFVLALRRRRPRRS